MKITIHRGINQIGGSITEIATDTTRILIDFGQNLPDGEGNIDDGFANQKAVNKLTKDVNAILYTHYHGDHIGLFHLVPDTVEQYIGEVAKKVVLRKHQQLSFIKDRKTQSLQEISIIERMKTYNSLSKTKVGDITITPFFVSHSAYDAYMFLIETDKTKILHTGDFRGHGYLSKNFLENLEKRILKNKTIDLLITEGTMLSRLTEKVMTENELQNETIKLMKQYKNVFIMSSSTDMERLASFFSANKKIGKKPFVCDEFQQDILGIFTETAGKKSNIFNFHKTYSFNWRGINPKLFTWMKNEGFTMMVRASDKFEKIIKSIKPEIKEEETLLIFSMWKEYINPKSKHKNKTYYNFTKLFPKIKQLHTSGHASAKCLVDMCNLVNPTNGIIPIHSEYSDNYRKLPINEELKDKIITSSTSFNNIEIKIEKS